MRVVLDTNVVVSALLWRGPPTELLHAARAATCTLFSSIPMLAELTDVLARPKFARRIEAAGLSVEALVAGYAALVAIVRPVPVSGIAPDPDDDVVIGTALAASAALVVTGDKPLLSVGSYRTVTIIDTAEALRLIAA